MDVTDITSAHAQTKFVAQKGCRCRGPVLWKKHHHAGSVLDRDLAAGPIALTSSVATVRRALAEWTAKAVLCLCGDAAKDLRGTDFSLKDDEAKRRVALIL